MSNGLPDFEHPISGLEEGRPCCCIYTCIGHHPFEDIARVRAQIFDKNKNLYSVTILRDPVNRLTSEYWYVNEIIPNGLKPQFVPRRLYPAFKDGTMTLSNFVKIPEKEIETQCCGTVNNRQTMMLAGVDVETAEMIGEEKLLELAKHNLESFDYFGISDRWDESIELLLWTFGQSERHFKANNVTWNRVHPHPHPDQEERDLILKKNQLDVALINWATNIFNKRVELMRIHKSLNPIQFN